ncbi:MAG: hypothetical protein FE78DRAFT_430561 [Acidomyces sp. 'richmondensis']|nr:MAG: hypothetical protein FE78DRAFT_430561 [Acidomyces sp. 'richmondensis']
MAPLKPIKKDATNNRIQQILDYASKIFNLLQDRQAIPVSLPLELEALIKRSLPMTPTGSRVDRAASADTVGTQLWNAATNILRGRDADPSQRDKGSEDTRLVVLLRVFAYFLIDFSHHASSRRANDRDQRVRPFKLALKTCRFCLDNGELELAYKVMEKCSDFVTEAEDETSKGGVAEKHEEWAVDQQLTIKRLVTEFYLLRIAHACKSDRFDVADHLFTKLGQGELKCSAELAEKAAELFHEAGKALAAKMMLEPAAKWCKRGLQTLDGCEFEACVHDTSELRLAITATAVEVMLGLDGPQGCERATQLVDQLEAEYAIGNRIAVSLLHFKIITASDQVDSTQLKELLGRIVRLADITDKSFRIIMQTIHKTRRFSGEAAIEALLDLITLRLLPETPTAYPQGDNAQDFLEKALVTYIVFEVSHPEDLLEISGGRVQRLLDEIVTRCAKGLSLRAIHASQVLIWKVAGVAHPGVAEVWCRLLRHRAFDGAGPTNKAKIARKTIASALDRNDLNVAREVFFGMPTETQNESITRYLAFKLAVRSNDHQLAIDSLNIVTEYASTDPKYLYACVLEAQKSENRRLALAALQNLLDKKPPGTYLPSLLRCTARLLVSELESQGWEKEDGVSEVVQLFEHAACNIKSFRARSDDQWRADIQWWSKNAYNLSLKLCADINPELLIRLLGVCVRFLECYPHDDGLMHKGDLVRRKALCHFLSANALIVLARASEERSEYGLQCYLRVRQEVVSFIRCAESLIAEGDANHAVNTADLHARKFELLKFDLECILRLQQWDDLDQALEAFFNFKDCNRWDSLADLLIITHEHFTSKRSDAKITQRITELLERCVNATWKKDKDLVKMARWLRLAFSIHLQNDDDNAGLALKIVQQAAWIAKRGFDGNSEKYPRDELDWLACSAFNRAVDRLNVDDTTMVSKWMDAAMELARYSEDNGSLHANFTVKRAQANARMADGRKI